MPIIRVSLWPGRSHEQKAALAKALTDTMAEIGKVRREATIVIFEEVDKGHWAQGGVLASDA